MSINIRAKVLINSKDGGTKLVSISIDEKIYRGVKAQSDSDQIKYFTDFYHDFEDEKTFRRRTSPLGDSQEDDESAFIFPDPSLTPSEYVNAKENCLRLREAVEKLEKQQREVIIDLFVLGMRQREVAKKLGISQQAVSKVKMKALAKLKVKLGGKI
jgi:RNA polymerase sigma factor (sigma-70 family)